MDMTVTAAVLVSVATGILNGVIIVAVIKTNMNWVIKEIGRVEAAVMKAHERLDHHIEKHHTA